MEKISILIPTYNSEKYIEKCLNSVISQTYPNIEIIIIDGGSTDKTLDIVKKYFFKHLKLKYIRYISIKELLSLLFPKLLNT